MKAITYRQNSPSFFQDRTTDERVSQLRSVAFLTRKTCSLFHRHRSVSPCFSTRCVHSDGSWTSIANTNIQISISGFYLAPFVRHLSVCLPIHTISNSISCRHPRILVRSVRRQGIYSLCEFVLPGQFIDWCSIHGINRTAPTDCSFNLNPRKPVLFVHFGCLVSLIDDLDKSLQLCIPVKFAREELFFESLDECLVV